MDATYTLITVALVAWALQIALGFFQVRAFNRMLLRLGQQGTVKIGRTASRWRPRTIVVLVHDENGVILDAQMLKGATIFSRPKPMEALVNARIPLNSKQISCFSKDEQEAINCALSNK